MKKWICILLACWLPLFISAASAASMQMAIVNQSVTAGSEKNIADMPCHQVVKDAQATSQRPSEQTPGNQHHVCAACVFCVITGSFANFSHDISVHPSALTSTQPIFFTPSFHSQTYPPAIKPPIFLA